MAFGSFGSRSENQPMAEINMVPMIDVMLVLLIIFIVTAPLLTHSVKIELPRASATPQTSEALPVQISIDQNQVLYWDGVATDETSLNQYLDEASRRSTPPEIHLRVDRKAIYEKVAQFLAAAANRGLTKIAFITNPEESR